MLNFQTFSTNTLLPYREENRNGKDWLVVNGIPLVEGVLNGRLVTSDEFGAFAKDWDGVPVVIRHPKKNNGSARVPEPDVVVVGRFYNSKVQDKKLKGEFWLDKELTLSDPDGQRIIQQIYSNKPMEVSTGYFSASHNETGEWNGKKYNLVDKNLHPDHIALLPDEVGACSLKDGCGMNRNSVKLNCDACPGKNAAVYLSGDSFYNRMETLDKAFYGEFGNSNIAPIPSNPTTFYIRAYYDDHVVVESERKMYSVSYIDFGGEVVFASREKWIPVKRVEEYIPQLNVTGNLPSDGKALWEKVYEENKDEYGEEAAAKMAWGACRKAGWHEEGDEWMKSNISNISREDAEILVSAFVVANTFEGHKGRPGQRGGSLPRGGGGGNKSSKSLETKYGKHHESSLQYKVIQRRSHKLNDYGYGGRVEKISDLDKLYKGRNWALGQMLEEVDVLFRMRTRQDVSDEENPIYDNLYDAIDKGLFSAEDIYQKMEQGLTIEQVSDYAYREHKK